MRGQWREPVIVWRLDENFDLGFDVPAGGWTARSRESGRLHVLEVDGQFNGPRNRREGGPVPQTGLDERPRVNRPLSTIRELWTAGHLPIRDGLHTAAGPDWLTTIDSTGHADLPGDAGALCWGDGSYGSEGSDSWRTPQIRYRSEDEVLADVDVLGLAGLSGSPVVRPWRQR